MIKDKKTSEGLVLYVKQQLGKPYWYGCFGQISSEKLYLQKKKQYPNEYEWECKNNQTDVSPAIQLGVRVFDCSGLIKGFLWTDEHGTIEYNRSQDLSASRFYEMSPCKGEISTMPDIKGLLVFAKNHLGVYIGDGLVIDARSHAIGTVQTQLKSRPWTHWGYCPFIEYSNDGE